MAVSFSALDMTVLEDPLFAFHFRAEVVDSVAAAAGVHQSFVIITDILEGSVKVRMWSIPRATCPNHVFLQG